MSQKTLYHYTDPAGHQGITQAETIRSSYDQGVYLTSIPPELPSQQIATNNGNGVNKTRFAFRIHFPENEPKLKKVDSGNRDIYLFSGDLSLRGCNYNVIDRLGKA